MTGERRGWRHDRRGKRKGGRKKDGRWLRMGWIMKAGGESVIYRQTAQCLD